MERVVFFGRRAAFADRSTLRDTTVPKLDRPPMMPEYSDVELRAKTRDALTEKDLAFRAMCSRL